MMLVELVLWAVTFVGGMRIAEGTKSKYKCEAFASVKKKKKNNIHKKTKRTHFMPPFSNYSRLKKI